MLIDTAKLDNAQSLLDELQTGGGPKYPSITLPAGSSSRSTIGSKRQKGSRRPARRCVPQTPPWPHRSTSCWANAMASWGTPMNNSTHSAGQGTRIQATCGWVPCWRRPPRRGTIWNRFGVVRRGWQAGQLNPLAAINYAELLPGRVATSRPLPVGAGRAGAGRGGKEAARTIRGSPSCGPRCWPIQRPPGRGREGDSQGVSPSIQGGQRLDELAGLAERRGQWRQAEKVLTEARQQEPPTRLFSRSLWRPWPSTARTGHKRGENPRRVRIRNSTTALAASGPRCGIRGPLREGRRRQVAEARRAHECFPRPSDCSCSAGC